MSLSFSAVNQLIKDDKMNNLDMIIAAIDSSNMVKLTKNIDRVEKQICFYFDGRLKSGITLKHNGIRIWVVVYNHRVGQTYGKIISLDTLPVEIINNLITLCYRLDGSSTKWIEDLESLKCILNKF